jgi:hypothetical protein
MERILKEKLGIKYFKPLRILNEYRQGILNFTNFLEKLRLEVGNISGLIELTFNEINSIFGFLVDDLLQRIQNPNGEYFNPKYRFSIEALEYLVYNLRVILKENIDIALEFIERYKNLNKDLKQYALQHYNVKIPDFFKEIRAGDFIKAYLVGLFYADGYLLSGDKGNYGIGLELKAEDASILELLKKNNQIRE